MHLSSCSISVLHSQSLRGWVGLAHLDALQYEEDAMEENTITMKLSGPFLKYM